MKNSKENNMELRKQLIATIAKRHAAEREFMKGVTVKVSTETSNEYENVIAEEYQKVLKASINTANF